MESSPSGEATRSALASGGRPGKYRVAIIAATSVVCAYALTLTALYSVDRIPKHRVESAWMIFVAAATVAIASQRWRPRAAVPITPIPRRSTLLLVAVVTACVGSLYGSSIGLGLLSDDFSLVSRAASGDLFGGQFWRPVPLVLWKLLRSDWLLHLANVVLHLVNAVLVAALARSLGGSVLACAASALLFAAFPGSVEAVAWASGIQDVLVTTLCLGFVLAAGVRRRVVAWVLLPLMMLLALGTKETAIIAPVLATIVWWRRGQEWNWRPVLACAALAAAFAFWRLGGASQGHLIQPSRYFLKEMAVGLFGSLSLPFSRTELAQWPWIVWFTATVIGGTTIALASQSVRGDAVRDRLLRLSGWAALSVIPVWSMFFVSPDLQGSRYLYLSSGAWATVQGLILVDAPRGRVLRALAHGVAAVVLVLWAFGVRWHLNQWHEAARVRDVVLEAAKARLSSVECGTIEFTGVPDSVGGAYVFRNGFLEALDARRISLSLPTGQGRPACTLHWDGVSFR